MSDVMDISSDSSDTIILPRDTPETQPDDTVYFENLVNKYINSETQSSTSCNNAETAVSSTYHIPDSGDEESASSMVVREAAAGSVYSHSSDLLLAALSTKYSTLDTNNTVSSSSSSSLLSDLGPKSPKRCKTTVTATTVSTNTAKVQKQLEIEAKRLERARKKEEAEREKAVKKALAAAHKNIKPDECIKFITVHIDNKIVNNSRYGNKILNALKSTNITYKVESQIFPNTITWTRTVESHSIASDTATILTLNSANCDENALLLIMEWSEFVKHVDNNSLTASIESIISVLNDKKCSLAIFGLDGYFRYQKSVKNQELRSQVTSKNQKQLKDQQIYGSAPKISRRTMETALTELQLLTRCSYRTLDSAEDLSLMVVQFTKAVAQLPYKLQKEGKYAQTETFVIGDNKDCVQVDKNGNGLHRLWHQILTMFPLARLETAEAISAKYSTPALLVEAYEKCASRQEGEKLLQEIAIRRAAGPMTAIRKIGPELSKKIYNFFTSLNGDDLI